MKRPRQVGRFLQADLKRSVQTLVRVPRIFVGMSEEFLDFGYSKGRVFGAGRSYGDRDSGEELARLLGGIGSATEFRALAARRAAVIEDLSTHEWI